MKVVLINGSRREKGCTFTALGEVARILESEGIDTRIIHVGLKAVDGRIDEVVKETADQVKDADGLIVGSPVYYASPSGEVVAFLDRLFGVAGKDLRCKPAAAVVSARRGGTSASLDVLNKYFEFNQMPIVSSNYWNMVHGNTPEEVVRDEEGMQIMRVLAKNFAWIVKALDAAKKAGIEVPEPEEKIKTNFIR